MLFEGTECLQSKVCYSSAAYQPNIQLLLELWTVLFPS